MKTISYIFILSLFMACNSGAKEAKSSASEDSNAEAATTETKEVASSAPLASGDYNSLLGSYACDMEIPEVAQVLGVAESDLMPAKYGQPPRCAYDLKGYGTDSGGTPSKLVWGLYPSNKDHINNEIKSNLEKNEEYAANPKVYQNMRMVLSETKDCYLMYQPLHGRIVIYNGNYENFFVLNYGRKGAFGRTDEQHVALESKMTDLANYVLKKHRK